jgi:hypothetical protein
MTWPNSNRVPARNAPMCCRNISFRFGTSMRFPDKMSEIFNRFRVNVINVSIRHALPDPGSYLAWAREEVFAFVVYYKQRTNETAKGEVRRLDPRTHRRSGVGSMELITFPIRHMRHRNNFTRPIQLPESCLRSRKNLTRISGFTTSSGILITNLIITKS